jgi:hypothetical protein
VTCLTCGAELPSGAMFCGECGRATTAHIAPPSRPAHATPARSVAAPIWPDAAQWPAPAASPETPASETPVDDVSEASVDDLPVAPADDVHVTPAEDVPATVAEDAPATDAKDAPASATKYAPVWPDEAPAKTPILPTAPGDTISLDRDWFFADFDPAPAADDSASSTAAWSDEPEPQPEQRPRRERTSFFSRKPLAKSAPAQPKTPPSKPGRGKRAAVRPDNAEPAVTPAPALESAPEPTPAPPLAPFVLAPFAPAPITPAQFAPRSRKPTLPVPESSDESILAPALPPKLTPERGRAPKHMPEPASSEAAPTRDNSASAPFAPVADLAPFAREPAAPISPPEPAAEPEPTPGPESKRAPELASEPEPAVEPESEPVATFEPDSAPAVEPSPESEFEPTPTPEPELEPTPEPEPTAGPAPEPDLQFRPEAAPAVDLGARDDRPFPTHVVVPSPAAPGPLDADRATDDLDDIERTRIVPRRETGARFVLQFSTGESITVHGNGLLGRNPMPQPHEEFDQLVVISDPGKSVSKTHLEFGQEQGAFWVSDRFSGNGSIVREPESVQRRCEPGRRYRIVRGTRVDIGEQFFVVS